jgi:nucleosome assembly protein 1-like 1
MMFIQYLELQRPLYERREAIINGKAPATKEEIEAGEQVSTKDDEDYTPLPKDITPESSGIPHFWLTALRNHVGLNDLITDRDAEALKHLRDVRLEYLKDGEGANTETKGNPGFKISFYFEQNAYFGNDVLVKTYLYQEEVGYSGDFVYDRAIGTTITWKEDKDLTKEFEIKKQRNKSELSAKLQTNRTEAIFFQTLTARALFARPVPSTHFSTSFLLLNLHQRKP